MRYHGTVIRLPSEACSYILQVTYGCSHNRCTFCGTYRDKPFRVRPVREVLEDVALARRMLPHTRRVFLADGDALALNTRRLLPILDALTAAFPRLHLINLATLDSGPTSLRNLTVSLLVSRLFARAQQLQSAIRNPQWLILDEAHNFTLPADIISQADVLVVHHLTLLDDLKAISRLASSYALS